MPQKSPKEDWHTIGVTPLPPGYRVAYEELDENRRRRGYYYEPVVAILLQENRGEDLHFDSRGSSSIRKTTEPYPSRAIMGIIEDWVGGDPRGPGVTIAPADNFGGLVCILAPGEPDLKLDDSEPKG